jgi:DnaJ homolog subfamily C member 19
MIWLLLGLAAVGVVVLLGRGAAKAPTTVLKQNIFLCAAVVLAILAVLLALSGRTGGAIPALAGAVMAFMRYKGIALTLWNLGRRQPGARPAPRRGRMTLEEAYRVLGLPVDADADAVRAAHRRLIAQLHPDQGGTDYLAAQINEARDVLLDARTKF